MEDLHFWALQRLTKCRFLPGAWDKRFVRGLAAKPLEADLSEKQIVMVKKLAYKYRKQILAMDPDFDFDWTFDALDVVIDRKSLKSGERVRRKRADQHTQRRELVKRYGNAIPENIEDYWRGNK